jgi:hypothetical protein
MFDFLIHNLESVIFVMNHHLSSSPADLYREVGSPIPGIDLAHAGKIQSGDGRSDIWDVF